MVKSIFTKGIAVCAAVIAFGVVFQMLCERSKNYGKVKVYKSE